MIPEQTESFRRENAAREAARRPVGTDRPTGEGAGMRGGVARIDSNDGSGAYTITEQWWDGGASPADWTGATDPPGLVDIGARDVRGRDTGGADDLVRFWQQRNKAGEVETFIDVGGAAAVEGDDTWIDVSEADGTFTVSHKGPGSCCYSGSCPDDFELDQWGHVRRIYDKSIPGWVGPCA